jgi:hypothetical protein
VGVIERVWPWDSQPQEATGIDLDLPLARGLQFAITPANFLTNVTGVPQIAAGPGRCFAFDPAVVSQIDTGIANPNVVGHSGFLLVRHPSMSSGRNPVYMSSRVAANNGFAFYQSAAASAFPGQSFSIGYVHGSVAAYDGPSGIAGANTEFLAIGFTARVSGQVEFYVRGSLIHAVNIGGINQSSSTIRIGRDVFSNQSPGDYQTPLVCYWNRALSAREHAEMKDNPWQVFAPRRVPIPYTAAAPALPTLTALARTNPRRPRYLIG